jgi:hypothetical protein
LEVCNIDQKPKPAKIVRSAATLWCRICEQKFNSATLLRVHVLKSHSIPPPPQKTEAKVEVKQEKNKKVEQVEIEQKKNKKLEVERKKNKKVEQVEVVQEKCKTVEQVKVKQEKNKKVEQKIEIKKVVKNESSYCHVCQYQFPSSANLLRHNKRKHFEGEKFPCPECSREFKLEYDMKRHLRNIHGKNFQMQLSLMSCRVCRLSFETLQDFEKHLLESHDIDRHDKRSNDPTTKCYICCRSFTDGFRMIEHVVESHPKLPFICRLCGKQFVVSDGFVHHFTSTHLDVRGCLSDNVTIPTKVEPFPE